MSDSDNVANAEAYLARAERIMDSDSYRGDRQEGILRHTTIAQVYATLAVAEELRAVAKATYAGQV